MSDESLISKLSQIYEGWTEKPKVNESWFQERLKHCSPCEYNSANRVLNLQQQALRKFHGEDFCTACSCPLSKKLSVKRATCGLKELGKEPLWKPLALEGAGNLKGTSIENPGNEPYNIESRKKERATSYILNFGEVSENVIEFSFIVFAPIKYEFTSVSAGCTCTEILNVERLGEGKTKVNAKISTLGFGLGMPTIRQIFIKYSGGLVLEVETKIQKT
jgi:hypothetical protein